jgi:pimeloyl-ACP methyl ester carboxylesterase
MSQPKEPSTPPARTRLVALHSSASGARQWDAWREHLPADVDFSAPALIGYGPGEGENWSDAAPLRLRHEAARLSALLDQGGDEGVHLLGHSYGAAVALELALRRPARVLSLTLYEPVRFGVLRAAGIDTLWTDIMAIGRAVRAHVRARRCHEAGALFVDYWSGAGAWEANGGRRRDAIAGFMPKVDAEFGALFADELPLHAWSTLRMPVRLLAGTRSPAPTRRIAELLAQRCPRGSLQFFEGLGHMGPLQAPARVAAAVMAGLAGAVASGRHAMAGAA